ncbi:amidase family protein [Halobellus sp. EA9]|uniref:amidase family protein n=1 Tax=Halobellus sp. EA9 TaxID=3421647 RepID=UPI003EB8356B
MADHPNVPPLTPRFEAGDVNEEAAARLGEAMTEAAASLPPSPRFEVLHGSTETYGPRTDGTAPETDPHDAWVTRFELAGEGPGILDDLTFGLKDSIAVAGYPCTLGSELLADFVPSVDATVVGRLLDAGGTVVGKNSMDAFAMGDAGEFGEFGTTTNPHDETRLAGGSSSGSAAAVAAGECDAALGTDQAGSVRNPAAWCGLVGLKPTHGAVPYTAVAGMDPSFDHVGILTRDVDTNARVLTAIAGTDIQDGCRMDPRQPTDYDGFSSPSTARADPSSITIGVLTEGFDWPFLEDAVADSVRRTLDALEATGASLVDVSVPLHERSLELVGTLAGIGATETVRSDGVSRGTGGWHWAELAETLGERRRATPAELSPAVRASMRGSTAVEASEHRAAYARAKNSVLAAGRAYDRALSDCDVLALPTAPTRALEPADSVAERVERLGWLPANTGLFNQTGHPALSVPAVSQGDLPVGIQFVASPFAERTLYRVGRLVEDLDPAAV